MPSRGSSLVIASQPLDDHILQGQNSLVTEQVHRSASSAYAEPGSWCINFAFNLNKIYPQSSAQYGLDAPWLVHNELELGMALS